MIAALILALCGQASNLQQPSTTVAHASESSDIGKLTEIAYQMRKSVVDLPSDMHRIAPCQFRAESRDFSAGMLRQLQARLETVLRDADRVVVEAPELRTLRIVATDTTFHVSNTAPDLEEMSKLADRLRVDGFLEGSCARTAEGDFLVSLRICRAKTGEIVWSDNFVAGPNRSEREMLDLDFSFSVPFSIFPAESYTDGGATCSGALMYTNAAAAVTITENITRDKRFQASLTVGYTHLISHGVPSDMYYPDVHMGSAALEFTGVFFRKPNPDMGYWLGTYIGYEEFIPALYREPLGAFRLGYRSKLSRHFSVSGGIMVMPFQHTLTGIVSNKDQNINLERIGYEIAFLHYTF